MEFGYWDLVGGLILTFVLGAIFSLLGVALGGLFVLRASNGGYEPLLPPLRDKDEAAVNIDDLVKEDILDEAVDAEIEKIFAQRSKEDPAAKANSAMKEQMNVFSE